MDLLQLRSDESLIRASLIALLMASVFLLAASVARHMRETMEAFEAIERARCARLDVGLALRRWRRAEEQDEPRAPPLGDAWTERPAGTGR